MMEIDNELLAAYAEGKVTQQEREAVRQYLVDHPEEMESVMMLMDNSYDDDNIGTLGHDDNIGSSAKLCRSTMAHDDGSYLDNLSAMLDDMDAEVDTRPSILPMGAMAAQNIIDSQCVIRCEGIALRHFGIDIADEDLIKESEREGYLKPEGTALHNIGRLAGARGLNVSHRYHCNIEDIQEALATNNIVIAAIDGNELLADYAKEQKKDKEEGLTPNHAVILNTITHDEVTITDSATTQQHDTYPLSQFLDAWDDSSNYLTIISNNEEYIPHPVHLDDVEVEDELLELREAIAENAHEVWAESRRKEGWTYGPVRDDQKKQNPDMLPYNRLPESEKEYDRIMAMNTIKLVKKLGWEFKKK